MYLNTQVVRSGVVYLQCSRATAGHGGTTVTAGTASLRLSRCSVAAGLSGTEGTAPGQGPEGPEGSTEPEGSQEEWVSVLNRAESTESYTQTPERTFSEPL